jgi:hypothetical protein
MEYYIKVNLFSDVKCLEKIVIMEKYTMVTLAMFTILSSIHVISLVSLTAMNRTETEDPETVKNKNAGGGTYKTKEEIEKAPSDDHPCNLTKTTVRITFPELKGELFINLLGYKEPNLIRLMRCKGTCGNDDNRIACVPTSVQKRSLNMVVRSHLHGQESKQKYKDVTLVEHLECGCQCRDASAALCAGTFNAQSCECECEGDQMKSLISTCTTRAATYWDYQTCQCKLKKTAHDCITTIEHNIDAFDYRAVVILCYTLLGSCFTLVVILACSAWKYRRKLTMMGSRLPRVNNRDQVLSLSVCDLCDTKGEGFIMPSNGCLLDDYNTTEGLSK